MAIEKGNTAIICLSPNSGGMELDAIKLATKLSPLMQIVLFAKENCFVAKHYMQCQENSIQLETVSFKKSLSLNIILKARSLILKHNIKNVIFFGASELKSLYFAFLGLDINLIIRHGTTKSKPKKDFFHKLIYSNVNYHVSICKHLLNNVRYIVPFAKGTKEKLIYSSLNAQNEIVGNKDNNMLTLVHVGRIAKGKGQYDAIKACEGLYQNNIKFKFYIVGGCDNNYQKEFLSFYETLSYKDSIELVGFTTDVQGYLEKSDIFLFPSYGEGLSNAFLEALVSQLLCICYDNTSFPELEELGFHFIMAKNRDIEDLKEKLLQASNQGSSIQENLAENKKLIQNIFSEEKEMEEYFKILE